MSTERDRQLDERFAAMREGEPVPDFDVLWRRAESLAVRREHRRRAVRLALVPLAAAAAVLVLALVVRWTPADASAEHPRSPARGAVAAERLGDLPRAEAWNGVLDDADAGEDDGETGGTFALYESPTDFLLDIEAVAFGQTGGGGERSLI